MSGTNRALREFTRRTALRALGAGNHWSNRGVVAAPHRIRHSGPGRQQPQHRHHGHRRRRRRPPAAIDAFTKVHPEIKVKVQAIQAVDWKDFFTKILTMVAAGTPPDVVYVATEGAQLFAEKLAHPLDEYLRRDAADMREFFDDVHPSLVEAFMYKGSLYQLPIDWNAANMYYNTTAFAQAGLERPADDWTHTGLPQQPRRHAQGPNPGLHPVLLDQPALRRSGAVALRERHQLPEGNQVRRAASGSGTASTPTTPPAASAPADTSGWSPTPTTTACSNPSTTSADWSRTDSASGRKKAAAAHWSASSPPTG